jgi:predicted O-methyltransferase YrrM
MSLTWRFLKTVSRLHPPLRAEVKQLENFRKKEHYYSPIPRIEDVRRDEAQLFDRDVREIADVALDVGLQLEFLSALERVYPEQPFPEQPRKDRRYHLDNKYFPYSDGIFLYGMLRAAQPRKVLEVGSGFSSAALLDVNERFFDDAVECTFIEPDTGRLEKLLRGRDRERVRVFERRVQEVSLEEFTRLEAGDILFLDSSHVVKIGSDVQRVFNEILPALRPGVLIHFHDIFFPFEYPRRWVYRGVAWNEAYVLRAFLQHNESYRIVAWNDYLERAHGERIRASLPLCTRNSGSLWLRKE